MFIHKLGYVVIYRPEHPRSKSWGGCIYQHIVIMEEFIGRHLTENEVVHHVNGNRSDNRIENLQLLTNVEHATLHHLLLGHGKLYRCKVCGKVSKNKTYCCCKCSNVGQQKVSRPTKEELEMLVKQYPMTKIGEMFGVSDNAIRKWAKSYNIDKSIFKCKHMPV